MGKKLVILLLIILLSLYAPIKSSLLFSKDVVVFFSVGNGDSILIKSKDSSLLIDGGPNTYSSNVISRYTLDAPSAILATHLHSDHVSGLLRYLDNKNVNKLFYNGAYASTYESTALLNKSKSTEALVAGDKITVGNFNITVVWPEKKCDSNVNPNYCSIVLSVVHSNGKKILLMSDSEVNSQRRYLHQLDTYDYIKVPHQGSVDALDQEVLRVLSPELAVFSVGVNSYGHPDPSVVKYYIDSGINILRTDLSGDVVLYFE